MIDLTQWRVTIGLWRGFCPSKTSTLKQSAGSQGTPPLLLTVVSSCQLILSGDVELNPGPKTADDVCRILHDVLRNNLAILSVVMQPSLDQIVKNLLAKNIITRDTKNYVDVINEFEAKLKLQKDISKLEGCCQSFLDCLSCQGGPPLVAAQILATEWTREVHQQLDISLTFDTSKTQTQTTSNISTSVDDTKTTPSGADQLEISSSQGITHIIEYSLSIQAWWW
jgi:hypothetical protein